MYSLKEQTQMDYSEINSPRLKLLPQIEIVKCEKCGRYNRVLIRNNGSFHCDQCHFCYEYLDRRNKKGDSHNPELYPDWGFAIEGKTPRGNAFIQPYVMTDCPHCNEQRFLPWDGNRIRYDLCPCHTKPVKEPARNIMPVSDPWLKFGAEIPPNLARQMRNYCFENDIGKNDFVIKTIEYFFTEGGADD